jgi:hypothetical protein
MARPAEAVGSFQGLRRARIMARALGEWLDAAPSPGSAGDRPARHEFYRLGLAHRLSGDRGRRPEPSWTSAHGADPRTVPARVARLTGRPLGRATGRCRTTVRLVGRVRHPAGRLLRRAPGRGSDPPPDSVPARARGRRRLGSNRRRPAQPPPRRVPAGPHATPRREATASQPHVVVAVLRRRPPLATSRRGDPAGHRRTDSPDRGPHWPHHHGVRSGHAVRATTDIRPRLSHAAGHRARARCRDAPVHDAPGRAHRRPGLGVPGRRTRGPRPRPTARPEARRPADRARHRVRPGQVGVSNGRYDLRSPWLARHDERPSWEPRACSAAGPGRRAPASGSRRTHPRP